MNSKVYHEDSDKMRNVYKSLTVGVTLSANYADMFHAKYICTRDFTLKIFTLKTMSFERSISLSIKRAR